MTPTERDDRFVVFDAASASLLRVGVDVDDDLSAEQPELRAARRCRLGASRATGAPWCAPRMRGRVDQPSTTAVRDTAGNPPFATPLSAAGSIPLARAIETTQPAGLAPVTVDPRFRNASLQSWNVNVQRQLARDVAATVGYFGSRGKDLRISRNLNQPVNGVRPFPALSPSSPILPGAPLGNITQVESSGFSSYHAAWVSVTKRLSRGLQFDTSYTWSKSLDTNSLNSSGFAVQDSYDIPNQYGLSDFDARHRFVLSAIYTLPFTGTRADSRVAGCRRSSSRRAAIPSTSSRATAASTACRTPCVPMSPGPSASSARWTSGSIRRRSWPSIASATWAETSSSDRPSTTRICRVIKNMSPGGRVGLQFRVDVFDLFNHPNFGPPGNIVGSPTFGKITRTRLPTGEAGSSRQIQLAAKTDHSEMAVRALSANRADRSRQRCVAAIVPDDRRGSGAVSPNRAGRSLGSRRVSGHASRECRHPGGADVARRSADRLLRGVPGVRPLSPDEASPALADYIRRKYRGRRIDLVIAIADPALDSCWIIAASCFPARPSSTPGSRYRKRRCAPPAAASRP